MQQKKNPAAAATPVADGLQSWRKALWLVLFGGLLFFWPQCLDLYLAPRFLFLSAALAFSFFLVWKDLSHTGAWRLRGFDWVLLGWYGLNIASVSWAYSWSEGVFYAQKSLLLFLVYWLLSRALARDVNMTRQTTAQVIRWVTWLVCGIIGVQLLYAFFKEGLDNESLYEYASGLFGNKSLATEFLYFLLVFNVLFYQVSRRGFWLTIGLILMLFLLLQTRTVYVAVVISTVAFLITRATIDAAFRPVFLKRILPAGILGFGLLLALIAFKGQGSSLAERLNPLTYLESTSANERRFVWYKTGLLNQEHFWLGVGNGSWKIWFPSKNIDGGYRLEERGIIFTRVHNDYLEVQAEMGIVGLAWFLTLFLLAFAAAIWALQRSKTTAGTERDWHEILVAAIGLLGYCIIQFFDFPRERIEFQVILAMLFAWILYFSAKKLPALRRLDTGAKPFLQALVILGLGFNVLIGWKRVAGEIHNVALLEAQSRSDWNGVIREAIAAENAFYEYTDVALPLAFHEGAAWYRYGKMDKAVAAFDRAYQLHPWSFQVLNNYATALVQNKQYKEAIPFYEHAIHINPSFDDGKLNLSFVHYTLGEYQKAMDWLNQVDTIPNPLNDVDRASNARTNARQAEFRKVILEKMK